MLTTNSLQRVFRIKVGNSTGSSYTVEKNNVQYLVSASHIFKNLTEVKEIEIFHKNTWKRLSVQTVFNSHNAGDTIVFKLPQFISPTHQINFGTSSVVIGSPAYILGFPLGLMNEGDKINNNFPLPLIKGGLISAIVTGGYGIQKIYLDAHNNRGFSGGPIVWNENNNHQSPKIIGTISGYEYEHPTSPKTNEDWDLMAVNSGITIGYWIKDLFDQF